MVQGWTGIGQGRDRDGTGSSTIHNTQFPWDFIQGNIKGKYLSVKEFMQTKQGVHVKWLFKVIIVSWTGLNNSSTVF